MIGYLKRYAFLRAVKADMNQLLIFDGEPFIASLFGRYPGMRGISHQLMARGFTSLQAACTLLRLALVQSIEDELPAADRARLADYLMSDRERAPAPFPLAHWCRIYCWDMLVQAKLGKVPHAWYEDSVMDVYLAARGTTWADRSARRARARHDEQLPELDPQWLRCRTRPGSTAFPLTQGR
jgi:hypothetical protein